MNLFDNLESESKKYLNSKQRAFINERIYQKNKLSNVLKFENNLQ
jgi:hypothetical protein